MEAPSSSVELRPHPRFGESAHAARAFRVGEVVLCETPLLAADPQDPLLQPLLRLAGQHLERGDPGCPPAGYEPCSHHHHQQDSSPPGHQQHHTKHHQHHDKQWWEEAELRGACANYLAFCHAPAPVQQHILHHMHNTAPPEADAAHAVRCARLFAGAFAALAGRIAELLAAAAGVDAPSQQLAGRSAAAASSDAPQPPASSTAAQQQAPDGEMGAAAGAAAGLGPAGGAGGPLPDAALVEHALLVFNVNGHYLHGDAPALFAVASKLAHTCGPANAAYTSHAGRIYVVAAADIAGGDLLAFSYLDPMDLLAGTPDRRDALLDAFGFVCRCDRCSQACDDMRQLPCGACAPAPRRRGPEGWLPPEAWWGPGRAAAPQLTYHSGRPADGAAAGSAGAREEDAAASSSGGDGCWVCSGCGACVRDADAALFGAASACVAAAQAGGARVEGRLAAAARQAWGERPLLGDYDGLEAALLRLDALVWEAGSTLGPAHWAYHHLLTSRTDVLLKLLMWRGKVACEQDGMDPALMAQLVDAAVTQIADQWQQTWGWLCAKAHVDAAAVLGPVYASAACSLLRWSAKLEARWAGGHADVVASMRQHGEHMLERLQPFWGSFAAWPPELVSTAGALPAQVASARAAVAGGRTGGCGS